jgi:mannose-6-phosphate isomerase-like protein (cupin superfamily)
VSYPDDVGTVSARLRRGDDVEQLTMRSGTVARFVAPGAVTAGQFGLFEWHMQPRSGGPAAHFHKTFSESFYVMSGAVRLYDGADWAEARRELAEISATGRQLSRDEWTELYARHDQYRADDAH